jgi:ABC-type uncharacterized transport system substrate-binding protein
LAIALIYWAGISSGEVPRADPKELSKKQENKAGDYRGKKVLWVDSYHQGYEWSDGIERGIREVLGKTGVDLRVFRMDTKRDDSIEHGRKAGIKARAVVEEFKPDVIIATDDNAQKYLGLPYLKDTNLPVVFSGVNWDASPYGYPCRNVTGMIEIDAVVEMFRHLKQHARGNRVGSIGCDKETERKLNEVWNERFFHGKLKTYLVQTFEEFKSEFLRAQNEVDMLFLSNNAITGWDSVAAEKFLARNTRIPTASQLQHIDRFVVFVMAKSAEEQGEYPAQVALKILDGAKPSDFPLVTNTRVKLTVNLKMAKAAGIVLPVSLLKIANIVGQEAFEAGASAFDVPEPGHYQGKKLLWVDSYHQGYEWSDGIEKGILEVLVDSGVDLRIVRMDTKRNDSIEFGREAGQRAKAVLEDFKPDVVIATDDNAQKYFVLPYLKNTKLPVVFSGVNWDASMYGYPCRNVTGMVEVEPTAEMLKLFRAYSKGNRIGYISGDVETERKIADYYNKVFFKGEMRLYLVKTFEDFKREFLRAQQEVDMLYFYNYTGIVPWDSAAAEEFLARNTRVPTGSPNEFMAPFVIFTVSKLAQEQGSYAAKTALRILEGVDPASLPLTTNKRSSLTINLKMAKAAGIVLPVSILKNANVIGQQALEKGN